MTTIQDRLQAIVDETGLPFAEIDAGRAAGSQLRFSATHRPAPATDDCLCLTASLTKPVVAMAILQLAADGRLSLTQRIGDWLPEFRTPEFRRMTIRNLLMHTSGLPDQLPGNADLRARHADLTDFRRAVCEHGTEYTPGNDCRYSSMGFLLLGEIVREVTGDSLSLFLETRIFRPAGMNHCWLGLPVDRPDLLNESIDCVIPAWQRDGADWDWNSAWWRQLGAPWGGLLSTTKDLSRFCRLLLNNGLSDEGEQVLSPVICRAAVCNQTRTIAGLSRTTRDKRPWGYGWRLQWPDHAAGFGDFVPSSSAGHWGASGTLMWLDPVSRIYAVILTTTPFEESRTAVQRMSNVISAALA